MLSTKPGSGSRWAGAGGGTLLALLILLGVPSTRRNWRSMLGIVLAMTVLSGVVACGGKFGGGGTSTPRPGTTVGTYTFTISGSGNDSSRTTATTTFTLTVN
jgi:hypothetical protein